MFGPFRRAMLYLGSGCFALAFLLIAFRAPAPSSTSSGVKGIVVTVGCPAQRVGQRCSWPLAGAKLSIAGHTATTGKDGRFKIGLIPGSWTLTVTARNVGPALQQRRQFKVTVRQNRWTQLTVSFANGIE